jgi:hypothetical protein
MTQIEELLEPPLTASQGQMRIVTRYFADEEDPKLTPGDTRIVWDRNVQPEVDNAKEQFDKWRKLGYAAYSVNARGETLEVIRKFDPALQTITFTPPNVGG